MNRPQLPALTGLRFFAALGVVIVHFGAHLVPAGPLHTIAAHGDIGVSLFFVLSGFILAYTYLSLTGLRGTPVSFWIARIARVYPVYVFALVIAAGPLVWTHQATFGVVLSTPLLLQSWHADWSTAWNPPAWSLSAEALFYVCFPVIGGYLARTSWRVALCTFAGSWGASLALIVTSSRLGVAYETAVYNPLFRLPEFVCGVAAGVVFMRHPRVAWSGPCSLIGVALLMCSMAILGDVLPRASLNAGLFTPLLGLLIFALACGQGPLAAALSTRPMVALGEASYALYLLHVPMWHWLAHLGGRTTDPAGYSAAYCALYLVLIIAAALAVFRLVETPARHAIKGAYGKVRTHGHLAAQPGTL